MGLYGMKPWFRDGSATPLVDGGHLFELLHVMTGKHFAVMYEVARVS